MTAVALLLVALVPGAVIFRAPWLDRDRRAALSAEERIFWSIIISLGVSLAAVLALAAAGRYSFDRLLMTNAAVVAVVALAARLDLRLGPGAPRPGLSLVLPLILVALGLWRFFPPAEYVIGGKDPGVYVAEGVQIAQRGTFLYHDPTVAGVPAFARDLFFPSHQRSEYYGLRFMGFFVVDPERGTVVGQFPHLFPASIAIGYGLDGLTGARRTSGAWAILGLVAVYFAGAHVAGRLAAWAACVLLALHVVSVWFARYPNAEVVMQALLFAAVLAAARAQEERGGRFFGLVAGLLLGLLLFLRVDAALAVIAVIGGLALHAAAGGRWPWSAVLAVSVIGVIAALYLLGPMRAYAERPLLFLTHNVPWWHHLSAAVAAGAAAAGVVASRRHPAVAARVGTAAPMLLAGALVAAAIYALYFREPAGSLADYDAYALRHFTQFYLTLPGLVAALAGYALLARHAFWRSPALFVTLAVFACFFFYKVRIVPEHFWASRRFLPVILPGALLMAAAAACWGLGQRGWRRVPSVALGAVFLVLLGTQYARAARPILGHVEYAGMIRELEQIAAHVGDEDLLLVESRDAGSDAHVFGLPLAYIYAREVLVLASARPDRQAFGPFLEWARSRYRAVYFLGGGGTDLLSSTWTARSIASHRFQVPEYESAWSAYPRGVRRKEFDFGVYELLPDEAGGVSPFDLDVGIHDDLHVVRFHAKERADGRTIRWSQRQSFVSVPGMPPQATEVLLELSAGGRPPTAEPAWVDVYLEDAYIGRAEVADGFRPYRFPIPAEAAATAAGSGGGEPPRLRLVSSVWNPRVTIGTPDDRDLGVMVDRVRVR